MRDRLAPGFKQFDTVLFGASGLREWNREIEEELSEAIVLDTAEFNRPQSLAKLCILRTNLLVAIQT